MERTLNPCYAGSAMQSARDPAWPVRDDDFHFRFLKSASGKFTSNHRTMADAGQRVQVIAALTALFGRIAW